MFILVYLHIFTFSHQIQSIEPGRRTPVLLGAGAWAVAFAAWGRPSPSGTPSAAELGVVTVVTVVTVAGADGNHG